MISFAGAVVLASAAACGSGFLQGIGGGASDAGADAADVALCYDPVPAPPQIAEPPTSISLLFAVQDIRVDTQPRDAGLPPPTGRDLDRTCTCSGGPPSCVGPNPKAPTCDGPRGADNAVGQLFNQALVFLPSLDLGNFIRAGGSSILIDVQQWSGEADDPAVTVIMRMSQGLQSHVDGGTEAAKFDGTDVWTVDPGSLIGGDDNLGRNCGAVPTPCLPLFRDPKAYVVGGKLYARVDVPVAVSTPSGRLIFDMTDVTLIASLSKDRLDGQMVGRMPADRFLPDFAAIRDPQTGKSLCGNPEYAGLKAEICSSLDIASDPAKDNTGAPCDALSGALGFVAGPALVGQVYKSTSISSDCANFTDSCSN
jgi:hypothetical protein